MYLVRHTHTLLVSKDPVEYHLSVTLGHNQNQTVIHEDRTEEIHVTVRIAER